MENRVRAAESEIHEFDSSRDRDGIGLGEGAVSRAARGGDFVQGVAAEGGGLEKRDTTATIKFA
jgi:hypothetical protein